MGRRTCGVRNPTGELSGVDLLAVDHEFHEE